MFFAISTLFLLIIYILSRRFAIVWRVLTATLAFVLFALFLWALEISVRAEYQPWYEASPYKQIIALAFMIAGMVGKYLFDAIEVRRKKKSEGISNLKFELDRWDFFQPFIVAFIVFGAFWKIHGSEALSMSWLVISFQNGFFWQTILGKSR